ncbi:MAG: hypothetical protein H7328_09640 [Bdellovibrio sp.]|nr:hypothetical protein [Bdellovibrio sp.]
MAKKSNLQFEIKKFLNDANILFAVDTPKKFPKLFLPELPFDRQLLNLSPLYRESRKLYLQLGGKFSARVCSTMRGLSAQDIFKDEIEYTPAASEMQWFKDFGHNMSDANEEIAALIRFTEISIFHEQNHRVIWRLLPPTPDKKEDVCRYLNFAESLVVNLDMALGDQLGVKLSETFERMRIIYHPSGNDEFNKKSKAEYRKYLLAILATTYYALEILHNDDIPKAVDYVLPGQKATNRVAVRRGLQLSELFSRVTNPEWQNIYWQSSQKKLTKIQANSKEDTLYLPTDPLDLEEEFVIAHRVFDYFGL